jgi:predicted transcriptional regulator
MKKSTVFEAVATLLLILLIFTMYVMIAGSEPAVVDRWNTTIGLSPYLYAGDGGVLYVFNGNEISALAPDGSLKWSMSAPENWTFINEWTAPGLDQSERQTYFQGVDCSGMTGSLYNTASTGYFTGFRPESEPAVTSDDGTLYVYVRPDFRVPDSTLDGDVAYGLGRALGTGREASTSYARLMAISPEGKVLWTKPLANGTNENPDHSWLRIDDVIITVSGDRIYVYHPYNLTVLDRNGELLYNIDGISDPAAVDENGCIYAIKAGGPAGNVTTGYMINRWISPDYRAPSNTIEAFGPDGGLLWQKDMGEPVRRQELGMNSKYEYRTLPLYRDGILYVPLKRGMVALGRNGSELWTNRFDVDVNLLWQMPFDGQNNLYMTIEEAYNADHFMPDRFTVYVIKPGGERTSYTTPGIIYNIETAGDGVGYMGSIGAIGYTGMPYTHTYSSLTEFNTLIVTATDLTNGRSLWNFTVPMAHVNEMTMDDSSARHLDIYSFYNTSDSMVEFNKKHHELQNLSREELGPWEIQGSGTVSVLADHKTVYVSYYAYNYEYPASFVYPLYVNGSHFNPLNLEYTGKPVFNRSRMAYVSGILALDERGRLLWNRPTNSMVTTMAANNSTVYYSMKGGELSATQVSIAVGFALTATLYLFLRFFCVGAVARAKARLNKNDNRNRVLDFIVRNPGSSLYEIARGTGVNLGTVRYHLFILNLNHKVMASRTDGKYIRYFTNSGSYSKEEQLILSLMRRDAMGRVLGLMLERPGISNAGMARELGIKESVVSRCTRELAERGIVTKEAAGRGCRVEEAHREHVASAVRRIYSE